MTAVIALLMITSCISLALSQQKNWQAVTGIPLAARTRKKLRITGLGTLLLALLIAIYSEGGYAALLWPLLFALMSFLVAIVLGYCPSLLKPITRLFGTHRKT